MKSQKNDFYQSVLEMNLNPTKRNVYTAVDVGLKEAQYMAEDCYWSDFLNPLEEMLGQCITFRHGIITGYEHFVKYNLNEDLSNLVLNTELMLGLKHDSITSSRLDDFFDRESHPKMSSIFEPKRAKLEDSLFYQSVLGLGPNPDKNDVAKSYLIGINEAQCLINGIYSAEEDSEFRSLLKDLINWRYAHINGYQHFMKYGLNNNLGVVVSGTKALLQNQKKKVRDRKFDEMMVKKWKQEEEDEENEIARK